MSYEKFDSIIESNNRYFSQESILQELTNAVKRKKVEEKKETKEEKRQGKENEQFHQEGKFVVLKLASD